MDRQRIPIALSVPIFFSARLLKGCWYALRFHKRYGVSWFQVPYAFVLALVGCSSEIPGMLRAVRDESPPETNFR
jgi:hypothetical protein